MHTLTVQLGDRSYPIYIGSGLLNQFELIAPFLAFHQVMVVSNTTVWPLYGDGFMSSLQDNIDADKVVLPDGEQYKNLETLNLVFDELLRKQHNRSTTIIALGGGVVGDMAGFAAATYQRGINFIQVPTTLLSQVDSSVGGKTGVNHPLGKNMIGAFYQPKCVLIDINVLNTLPDRELSAGIAEVIKYGLITDAKFFDWLEVNIDALMARDAKALIYAIERSCQLKAEVVAEDEKESGRRAILNLGHTFGHAIESSQGYGVWLHGEAVAAGMVMACRMSERLGWIDEAVITRTVNLLARAKLPVEPPKSMSEETFLKYMSVDKKVLDGTLRLVLLRKLGHAVVTSDFSQDILLQTLGV